MSAEITLRECTNHSPVERKIYGWAWWWQAKARYRTRSGFARSEEQARARAEKAARQMFAETAWTYQRYTYAPEEQG